MKKVIVGLLVGLSVILLSGCGKSADPKVDEIKDKIIDRFQKFENENGERVKLTEDDFSFKIYKDEKLDSYLTHAIVPSRGEPNKIDYYFDWKNGENESFGYSNEFDKKLHSGNYEVIYKSGKFD